MKRVLAARMFCMASVMLLVMYVGQLRFVCMLVLTVP